MTRPTRPFAPPAPIRLGLLLACLAACDGEAEIARWEEVRRVDGDTTTVHTLRGQRRASPRLVEDRVIGVLKGEAPYIFGEVFKLADDHRGGVYVFDRQVPEIRHFDAEGVFTGTVGRAGEGPNEFEALSLGMVADADGVLYVHAWSNRRILRFARDGRPLDPWPLNSSYLSVRTAPLLFSHAPGRIQVVTRIEGEQALLVLEDGRTTDTLRIPELPGVPETREAAYGVSRVWSWHPNGGFLVGVNADYVLEYRGAEGVLRLRRDVETLPVHPEEAAEIRQRFEWMEEQPNYRPPDRPWVATTMPPYHEIRGGRDNRIWVRRNTTPIRLPVEPLPDGQPVPSWRQPHLYDLFEPDGAYLGEIRFPDGFDPFLFGDGYVWGVRRGDFDEPYVVRLRIEGEMER